MTFIQARRGGSRPNDQAEPEKDQGGFTFKGRSVEAIRETLVRRDVLGILYWGIGLQHMNLEQGLFSP